MSGSGDIRSQLDDLGLSSVQVKVGQVYTLPDEDISFPKTRLKRAKGEGVHDRRTVIVMQDGPTLLDPLVPTVLVAPTSSRIDCKTANDVVISAGEGGLDKDCVCMVDHVQPVLKTRLKACCGRLDNHRIEELQVLLAAITGRL